MDKSVVAVTLVSLFEAVEAAKVGLKWLLLDVYVSCTVARYFWCTPACYCEC